jgi:exopolysaccharide production protein ExoQ
VPRALALFLCTVFVLFLLRLERKHAPEVSHVLWIPTIWMLLIGSKPLGIWFGYGIEAGDVESGSPLDRLFLSGLLCLGLLILARRKFDWSSAIKSNKWIILLIAYMLVSTLWSDIPFVSFKRWTKELIAVVMAFLVRTEPDPRQALESLLRRISYILIPFSLLLIKYFAEYGRAYNRWTGELMWIGVTLQKNGLGRLCIIAAFFLIWALIKRWQGRDIHGFRHLTYADMLVLGIALWLLKGTPDGVHSATAFAALAVGLTMFIALLWMKKHEMYLRVNTLKAIITLVIGFGILTVFIGGSGLGNFASMLGRDETLTGRTYIWAELLPIAMQHPILGCGYGGFWTSATIEAYIINEAHSGYLEALMGLGFVGLFLLAMFLLSSCGRAQRELTRHFDWGALWICFLVMVVVHNLTETSFPSFVNQLPAVVLFLAVSSAVPNLYTQRVSREKGYLAT